MQKYFCAVYDYAEKADPSKGYWNPKKKKKLGGNYAVFRDNSTTIILNTKQCVPFFPKLMLNCL